jgi:hypothetical protein
VDLTPKPLGAKARKLLEWLLRTDGMLLESQVVASGMSRAIDDLILARLVTLEAHPTVKERTTPPIPATAIVLTDAGRTQQPSMAPPMRG